MLSRLHLGLRFGGVDCVGAVEEAAGAEAPSREDEEEEEEEGAFEPEEGAVTAFEAPIEEDLDKGDG